MELDLSGALRLVRVERVRGESYFKGNNSWETCIKLCLALYPNTTYADIHVAGVREQNMACNLGWSYSQNKAAVAC